MSKGEKEKKEKKKNGRSAHYIRKRRDRHGQKVEEKNRKTLDVQPFIEGKEETKKHAREKGKEEKGEEEEMRRGDCIYAMEASSSSINYVSCVKFEPRRV